MRDIILYFLLSNLCQNDIASQIHIVTKNQPTCVKNCFQEHLSNLSLQTRANKKRFTNKSSAKVYVLKMVSR